MKSLFLAATLAVVPLCTNAATIFYFSESSFTSATGATLLDDFEAFSPKDVNLPTVTSAGILYTPSPSLPSPNMFVASPGYNNFGPVNSPTTSSVLTSSGDEDFIGAVLSETYTALGFDVYLNDLGPTTVEFFSGSTLLLTATYGGGGIVFAGIMSDVPITSFRFQSTLGSQNNGGIDNVRVASASVPEVASVGLLLGLSAAGMLMARKISRR